MSAIPSWPALPCTRLKLSPGEAKRYLAIAQRYWDEYRDGDYAGDKDAHAVRQVAHVALRALEDLAVCRKERDYLHLQTLRARDHAQQAVWSLSEPPEGREERP